MIYMGETKSIPLRRRSRNREEGKALVGKEKQAFRLESGKAGSPYLERTRTYLQ